MCHMSNISHVMSLFSQRLVTDTEQNGHRFADNEGIIINILSNICLAREKHCYMYWLSSDQTTSHYLYQWWMGELTDACMRRQDSMYRFSYNEHITISWSISMKPYMSVSFPMCLTLFFFVLLCPMKWCKFFSEIARPPLHNFHWINIITRLQVAISTIAITIQNNNHCCYH